jgi:hypothetical protein
MQQYFLYAARTCRLQLFSGSGFEGRSANFDVHGSILQYGSGFCLHRSRRTANVTITYRAY